MFGQLHGEHTHRATCAIDHDAFAWLDARNVAQEFQSRECAKRRCGCVLVAHAIRLDDQVARFRNGDIFGIGAAHAHAEHRVPDVEAGHMPADGFDPSGKLHTGHGIARAQDSENQANGDPEDAGAGEGAQSYISGCNRTGMDLDQYFVVFRPRPFDLFDRHHLRWAISAASGDFHNASFNRVCACW